MKLDPITDIHEHVEFLRIALDRFARENVDQIVVSRSAGLVSIRTALFRKTVVSQALRKMREIFRIADLRRKRLS